MQAIGCLSAADRAGRRLRLVTPPHQIVGASSNPTDTHLSAARGLDSIDALLKLGAHIARTGAG